MPFQKGNKINLGRKHTEEHNEKIGQGLIGNKNRLGIKHTREERERIRQRALKNPKFLHYWLGKTGEGTPHWKGEKCKKRQERNDPAYSNWVRSVKKRDSNTCRLKNKGCSGYNIVHHIKGWTKYPELRYKTNNGITLCQAHHPRRRAKEKRLEEKLQNLILVSSKLNCNFQEQ